MTSIIPSPGNVLPIPNSPAWRVITVPYTAMAAAALTNDIELFSLPAGEIIHAVRIRQTTAFGGGAIASYTMSVGIVGTLAKYSAAHDVFAAPGANTYTLTATVGAESLTAATSIRVAAVTVGANLNAATAGSAEIGVLTSRIVP